MIKLETSLRNNFELLLRILFKSMKKVTITSNKKYLLTLLVEVYALLEVAVELNTLSNSARAAYLSEDALD